ncbi:hypothetical protein CR513_22548, partial [Mucuna pruriens]
MSLQQIQILWIKWATIFMTKGLCLTIIGEQTMEEVNLYEQMIMDHVEPLIGQHIENMEENPNHEAQKFFDMLAAAQAPLWEGCDNYSKLSISLSTLILKSNYKIS